MWEMPTCVKPHVYFFGGRRQIDFFFVCVHTDNRANADIGIGQRG